MKRFLLSSIAILGLCALGFSVVASTNVTAAEDTIGSANMEEVAPVVGVGCVVETPADPGPPYKPAELLCTGYAVSGVTFPADEYWWKVGSGAWHQGSEEEGGIECGPPTWTQVSFYVVDNGVQSNIWSEACWRGL